MKNKDIEIFINEMMGYPKKLIKKLGGSIDEDLLKLNLGMPHFAIMDIILKSDIEPMMSEIGKKLGISKAMITHIIDTMEEKGLVSRVEDPKDRRIIRIHVTKIGKGVISKIESHHRNKLKSFLESLSSSDRNLFVNAMRVTHKIFDKYNDKSDENK
ncbi:MAG: hypothetical protein A2452_10985 [Candidatus Firestonebacteria bacterium RIFOXYC2_FULL_39_67]|nr:MAG: hypothetical protein A2452_10985 [Candidatus Firestonebacteria bacterium RIFOXYC2_FULL_39_67]HAB50589.1 hypothetical protein [Ignavibacteriales bacterium]